MISLLNILLESFEKKFNKIFMGLKKKYVYIII
jgi:hypothetical protein